MLRTMKRVVVIGAGPAGLAALRSLLGHKDELQFIAYETSDRVGGTWILDDPYKPTSMYSQLRTNLPKEIMAYQGFPFSTEIYESFVGHKEVLEYLESFTQHYKLHEYIKFRHRVVEVDPVMNAVDETKWNVTVEDCESGSISTNQFDFVLVCNGHYTVPLLTNIEGQSTCTGKIIHAHDYRSPFDYKDKTVLVLGAGPSGIDVSIDLSPHVPKVYLSHNKEALNWKESGNIVEVAGVEKIAGDDIVLKDGTIVHADVILMATGYRFSFPFLSKKCHPVIEDEAHVSSIYKQIVDINNPSLFYIGLGRVNVPFPQFSYQCDYAVACMTGEIKPMSREVMEQEYKERCEKVLKESGRLKFFHDMGSYQWEYNSNLAAEANVPPLAPYAKPLFDHILLMRQKNIFKYKDHVYRVNGDGKDFTILVDPEVSSS